MTTRLMHGDSLDVLKEMKANSVDTIVTDPPYGLSFMGKKWDYDVPSVELWTECLRVLKPGGTMLCFAGSRTQHRMAVNVEDAGFDIKDTVMWLYGSGFPKATDISKQLDKGVERKVIGVRTDGAGNKNSNNVMYDEEHKFVAEKVHNITEPATPEAKLWNGWKSHGLKPAYEPILVAVKPNEGTYAANALKHGVGGLNIDGGRIGTGKDRTKGGTGGMKTSYVGGELENNVKRATGGRFPANIILDEEACDLLDEQSGVLKSGVLKKDCYKEDRENASIFAGGGKYEHKGYKADQGGASRFFYCAKASKAERNAGCEGLEEKEIGRGTTRRCGNCDKPIIGLSQTDKCVCDNRTEVHTKKLNHHPTVKPLKLMEYLCTLTKTPTGGTVLDPFMGSGTTGVACKNTGRDFIGIEREAEYIEIARARLGDN